MVNKNQHKEEESLSNKGFLMENNELENFDENCIGMRMQFDNPIIFYLEKDLKEIFEGCIENFYKEKISTPIEARDILIEKLGERFRFTKIR